MKAAIISHAWSVQSVTSCGQAPLCPRCRWHAPRSHGSAALSADSEAVSSLGDITLALWRQTPWHRGSASLCGGTASKLDRKCDFRFEQDLQSFRFTTPCSLEWGKRVSHQFSVSSSRYNQYNAPNSRYKWSHNLKEARYANWQLSCTQHEIPCQLRYLLRLGG
jgi:hypothetical protein